MKFVPSRTTPSAALPSPSDRSTRQPPQEGLSSRRAADSRQKTGAFENGRYPRWAVPALPERSRPTGSMLLILGATWFRTRNPCDRQWLRHGLGTTRGTPRFDHSPIWTGQSTTGLATLGRASNLGIGGREPSFQGRRGRVGGILHADHVERDDDPITPMPLRAC